jgi:hypothetical protein
VGLKTAREELVQPLFEFGPADVHQLVGRDDFIIGQETGRIFPSGGDSRLPLDIIRPTTASEYQFLGGKQTSLQRWLVLHESRHQLTHDRTDEASHLAGDVLSEHRRTPHWRQIVVSVMGE